jgi:hypothetical protein
MKKLMQTLVSERVHASLSESGLVHVSSCEDEPAPASPGDNLPLCPGSTVELLLTPPSSTSEQVALGCGGHPDQGVPQGSGTQVFVCLLALEDPVYSCSPSLSPCGPLPWVFCRRPPSDLQLCQAGGHFQAMSPTVGDTQAWQSCSGWAEIWEGRALPLPAMPGSGAPTEHRAGPGCWTLPLFLQTSACKCQVGKAQAQEGFVAITPFSLWLVLKG